MNRYYPQFPLYIPSKGRYDYMITSKALTKMGVKHYIVIEPFEVKEYKKAIKKMGLLADILILDNKFKEKYELCDNLGLTKSTGPGPARNYAWEHSKNNNYKWHWVMDDNIKRFFRFNKNLKVPTNSPSIWRVMEDFCLRYTNVGMAGPNYYMFVDRKSKLPPFITNTRIYSCNLIRNDIPFKWRGRYNEDTILSIDMLKKGWCTIQFNVFLQEKMGTQVLKGGNTSEFYHKEGAVKKGNKYAESGTLAKSQMQVKVHPDISKIIWRYGRIHHYVNYRPFKKNKLIKKDINIPNKINNYGMTLKNLTELSND